LLFGNPYLLHNDGHTDARSWADVLQEIHESYCDKFDDDMTSGN